MPGRDTCWNYVSTLLPHAAWRASSFRKARDSLEVDENATRTRWRWLYATSISTEISRPIGRYTRRAPWTASTSRGCSHQSWINVELKPRKHVDIDTA